MKRFCVGLHMYAIIEHTTIKAVLWWIPYPTSYQESNWLGDPLVDIGYIHWRQVIGSFQNKNESWHIMCNANFLRNLSREKIIWTYLKMRSKRTARIIKWLDFFRMITVGETPIHNGTWLRWSTTAELSEHSSQIQRSYNQVVYNMTFKKRILPPRWQIFPCTRALKTRIVLMNIETLTGSYYYIL